MNVPLPPMGAAAPGDAVDILVRVDETRCAVGEKLSVKNAEWLTASFFEIASRGALQFHGTPARTKEGETRDDVYGARWLAEVGRFEPRIELVAGRSRIVFPSFDNPDEKGRLSQVYAVGLGVFVTERAWQVSHTAFSRKNFNAKTFHDFDVQLHSGVGLLEVRGRFNATNRNPAVTALDKKFGNTRDYSRSMAAIVYPYDKASKARPDVELLDPVGDPRPPSWPERIRAVLRHFVFYADQVNQRTARQALERLIALPDRALVEAFESGQARQLLPFASFGPTRISLDGFEVAGFAFPAPSFAKRSLPSALSLFWGISRAAWEILTSSEVASMLDWHHANESARLFDDKLFVPLSDGTVIIASTQTPSGSTLAHTTPAHRQSPPTLPTSTQPTQLASSATLEQTPRMTEPSSSPSSALSAASNAFFDKPILNSPYKRPTRHWELDKSGQPTQHLIENRRRASFVTPIPKPKKQSAKQAELGLDDVGISSSQQAYQNTATMVNEVREQVDRWRREKPSNWNVTPETARLLDHWRNYDFKEVRPFFCQLEAVETIIWLTEVAPHLGKAGKVALDYLERASNDAYPDATPVAERLMRIALKLATGAGKTTVMAMLIAWQTVNAVRRPNSKRFTKGFLIVAPGLTIKDRLRVLLPNDPDSYYSTRELVPQDMLLAMREAKLVITNFHAFRLRERIELSKGGRSLLQGRGEELDTLETEGQMIQRVMPDLMGMKDIMVLNDEAHHCYREKPGEPDEEGEDVDALDADGRKEAEKNSKAARQWITGLESVKRKLGVSRVIDLSATPFFLSGSGYVEGTLFPWTMSDFSLMDAIECGIVKLPRVPIADNIPGVEMPMYRELWKHIGKHMPKKRRGQGESVDPLDLPPPLQTALEALYGHYELTYNAWMERGSKVPPCFIVVCNNTTTSKLVYDFISGFHRKLPDGTVLPLQNGRLKLFRNFDDNCNPLPRPNTLLIDSEQLESGEALDDQFRGAAADEIERFRREIVERGGAGDGNETLTDQQLLREVMNTVGKEGTLGGGIRCVVSVAMLTEGWDANTVTHVLGVRAFGTQLLCEQVIGRALRRQSYELNEDGLFQVEYADILGIPFDFTAKPVIGTPQPPQPTTRIYAQRERDALEIRFPRVVGYRVELPATRLEWTFNEDSKLVLKPELVGATETQNSGIIGERVNLNLVHTGDVRPSTVVYELTRHLILTRWRDDNGEPRLNLFGQLKRIARDWLDTQLECVGGTYPAQLVYKTLADLACARITDAITRAHAQTSKIAVTLDPFNPTGSSAHVNYRTSRDTLWNADANKSHVNMVVLDSSWEAELCRVVEAHPRVRAYVKNAGLGFEVPYLFQGEPHHYRPDFIVRVEDGHGEGDLLNLVIEIKGYKGENAKDKKATMETRWIPGVNHDGRYGRWAFAELGEVYQIESDFKAKVESELNKVLANAISAAGEGN